MYHSLAQGASIYCSSLVPVVPPSLNENEMLKKNESKRIIASRTDIQSSNSNLVSDFILYTGRYFVPNESCVHACACGRDGVAAPESVDWPGSN